MPANDDRGRQRYVTLVAALLSVAALSVAAQSSTPAFEVVSIKRNKGGVD